MTPSRSIGSRRSSHRRAALRAAFSAALAFALVPCLPSVAGAQKLKVAVLPFNGPQGAKAQAEVFRILRKDYDLVPQQLWDASAKKLFATSHSADDIGAVSSDLGVQVAITGAIKNDGGWTLIVTVRHGPSGKAVQKLKYNLKGPRIEPLAVKQLAAELPPVVDQAVTPPPDENAPSAATPDTAAPPPVSPDEESPLAKKEPPPEPTQERPAWAPFIDASVGFELAGRNFSFDQPGLTGFNSSVVPGLRVDVTGYPLAFLATHPGSGANAASGLGVGVTFDLFFWPDSQIKGTTITIPTSENRVEVGIRWHWNVQNKPTKPELLVSAEYGQHSFSIAKKPGGGDVGLPDVSYSYLTLGLGARLPLAPLFGLLARFNYHLLFDTGEIQAPSPSHGYGPGGGYGLRFQLGAESHVWKGLTLRLLGFYERFGLSFDNPTNGLGNPSNGTNCPCGTTGGATDQFYGFTLTVGYVY